MSRLCVADRKHFGYLGSTGSSSLQGSTPAVATAAACLYPLASGFMFHSHSHPCDDHFGPKRSVWGEWYYDSSSLSMIDHTKQAICPQLT